VVLIGFAKGPVDLHRWDSLRGDVIPFKQSLLSWCSLLGAPSMSRDLGNVEEPQT
jgi:hypothetical protein